MFILQRNTCLKNASIYQLCFVDSARNSLQQLLRIVFEYKVLLMPYQVLLIYVYELNIEEKHSLLYLVLWKIFEKNKTKTSKHVYFFLILQFE